MGKPIEREFTQGKTILKFFDYKGAACVVDEDTNSTTTGGGESAVTTPGYVEENGRKIFKAGTPYPSNDGDCLGYLLHDVDITDGDAPGTYIFEGSIDKKKLTENKITISAAAKSATPRVTFFD